MAAEHGAMRELVGFCFLLSCTPDFLVTDWMLFSHMKVAF